MKSPFAIFRKHQKVLMVILAGLAMFGFVVLDSIRGDRSDQFLPILCAMIGAAAFAFFGHRTGDYIKYGAVGAAVGFGIGWFIPANAGPKPAVETTMGNLTHADLQKLMVRRQTANNFIELAFQKIIPPMGNNPYMAEMINQRLRERLFGFGRGGEGNVDDVVLGYLMDKEADEMGIVVTDSTVSDYIHRVTNKRL